MKASADTADVIQQLIEELAALRADREPAYLDTRQLATRFGVSCDWIRENAAALGGVKLSRSRNGEWRFNTTQADQRFHKLCSPKPKSTPQARARRARNAARTPQLITPRPVAGLAASRAA